MKFGWDPMGQDEKNDIALVREARKGLGDDADLMIDAGLVWDAKTAIQRARAFSDYRIFWLEEPLLPDDYDGYRKLSEAVDVRIAAGEEESERKSYLELMDRGKIDIVQVDLTRCGGFTEGMKIASLAADRGLPVRESRLHHLHQRRRRAALPEFHSEFLHPRIRRRGRHHPARPDHSPGIAAKDGWLKSRKSPAWASN